MATRKAKPKPKAKIRAKAKSNSKVEAKPKTSTEHDLALRELAAIDHKIEQLGVAGLTEAERDV
jgi:hypothetical protein